MTAIITHYHGPTDTRGSRYSATAGNLRFFLPMDYEVSGLGNHEAAAKEMCRRLGFSGKLACAVIEDRKGQVTGCVWVRIALGNTFHVIDPQQGVSESVVLAPDKK
jgi:hypothetical protein